MRRNTDGTMMLETEGQRSRELAICEVLAREWGHDYTLLYPELSSVEGYSVKDRRVVAVFEIKPLNARFPRFGISKRKADGLVTVANGWNQAEDTGRIITWPVYVLDFKDGGIGYIDCREVVKMPLGTVGRHDRPERGSRDTEPAYRVRLSQLKILNDVIETLPSHEQPSP